MKHFIDIHTHHYPENDRATFSIYNIMLHDRKVPSKGLYSAGWHPWMISNHTVSEIEQNLKMNLASDQVILIGECGLDRAIQTPIEEQIQVFKLHLTLAEKYKKPVLIHAVRTYADLLHIFKQLNFSQPVILHDYRGNAQQTLAFLKYNTYFSFGESIEKHAAPGNRLKELPLNRLFFETDESLLSIENIYLRAASVLGVSIDELTKQVHNNFKIIFGDELVK